MIARDLELLLTQALVEKETGHIRFSGCILGFLSLFFLFKGQSWLTILLILSTSSAIRLLACLIKAFDGIDAEHVLTVHRRIPLTHRTQPILIARGSRILNLSERFEAQRRRLHEARVLIFLD